MCDASVDNGQGRSRAVGGEQRAAGGGVATTRKLKKIVALFGVAGRVRLCFTRRGTRLLRYYPT